jgi:glycosyltransferase involved in cell wall biosynthesis
VKILHVVPSADPALGGVIESVRLTCETLRQTGHQAEILCGDDPASPWLSEHSEIIHALGPGRFQFGYAPKLLVWLRENAARYDVVIVNGLWQYVGFAVRQALHRSKTPYVVYTHGMLDPWFKHTYPLKHFKKLLYWPWGEYRVLRDAQAVLFICEEERLLARQSFRYYRAKEVVVSLGTAGPVGDAAAQRTLFLSQYPQLEGKRPLLFLSRLHVKKGCDLLIEAFGRIAASDPTLYLVMAGPDQTGWKAELERRAQALGVGDRIIWPGMLKGDLKWGAFFAAEAFLLPSHQENFGIAVAEALACSLPVLISDKVNIWREIVADGAGLVATDTPEGVEDLLRRWAVLSDADKAEMRPAARLCFERRFEIDRAVANLLAAVASVS